MTAILAAAARNTTQILDLADRAKEALRGDQPRSNGAGVLSNPANFLDDLRAARELIDRAITLHDGTTRHSAFTRARPRPISVLDSRRC